MKVNLHTLITFTLLCILTVALLMLPGCATTEEQNVSCTEQEHVLDTALKAWMVANGYGFQGGC